MLFGAESIRHKHEFSSTEQKTVSFHPNAHIHEIIWIGITSEKCIDQMEENQNQTEFIRRAGRKEREKGSTRTSTWIYSFDSSHNIFVGIVAKSKHVFCLCIQPVFRLGSCDDIYEYINVLNFLFLLIPTTHTHTAKKMWFWLHLS